MKEELEKVLKEAVMAWSRYNPSILLEGLGKTITVLSHDTDVPAENRTEDLTNTNLER
jgi:hypothetical protein